MKQMPWLSGRDTVGSRALAARVRAHEQVVAPAQGDTAQRPMDRAFIALLLLVSVTGLAEPGSLVKVYDNGVLVGQGYADASGNYSITTSALADGAHPLSVSATDTAGM